MKPKIVGISRKWHILKVDSPYSQITYCGRRRNPVQFGWFELVNPEALAKYARCKQCRYLAEREALKNQDRALYKLTRD